MSLNPFKKEKSNKKPTAQADLDTQTVKPVESPTPAGRAGALSYAVLVAPHVTEKAARLESVGQYVFRVHPDANQVQVRKAIETAYEVKVAAVQIINIHSKNRRLGKHMGIKSGYKKAVVSLRSGDKIQLIAK